MNIVVFDTETTTIDKPFCYNVGYVIYSTSKKQILLKRDFVVEQVWHNTMLFSSAYYAEKRPLYINRMRGGTAVMDKWGYIVRQMRNDFKAYDVKQAYAYNSSFDERVFNFNCDWYKTLNCFDTIPIYDIRKYFIHTLQTVDNELAFYESFCEDNFEFTENHNYSTTAETAYRYIAEIKDFNEEHTALADSEIELDILSWCLKNGCELGSCYKVPKTLERVKTKTLKIVDVEGEVWTFDYNKKIVRTKGETETHYLK